jgi:hypothetical protein
MDFVVADTVVPGNYELQLTAEAELLPGGEGMLVPVRTQRLVVIAVTAPLNKAGAQQADGR